MLGQCGTRAWATGGCPMTALVIGRLRRWDQMFFSVADQVGFAHVNQGFSQHGPVIGVVVTQEGFMQASLSCPFGNRHAGGFVANPMQWVALTVVHRGGHGHWRGVKRLYLIGAKTVLF